jgi:hypothetical protein
MTLNVQFTNPNPATRLIVATINTISFVVRGNVGDSIAWSVSTTPSTALSGKQAGTAVVQGGVATISIGVKSRPDWNSNHAVLVSVWDPNESGDPDHYTALFVCARPSVQSSTSRTYGETADPTSSPFNPADPDPHQIVMLTLWLTDADDGAPLKGSKVSWRGSPANPIYVLTADNKSPPTDPGDITGNTFLTYTDQSGRTALKFANTAPSIIAMSCTWGNVTTERFGLVFSALGTPWLKEGVVPPNMPALISLGDYAGTGVPVTIVSDPSVDWMTPLTRIYVSVWLNGISMPVNPMKVGDTMNIPNQYFMSLNATDKTPNQVAYTVVPVLSGNGLDSNYLPVNVEGAVTPARPKPSSPIFKNEDIAPTLAGNPDTVDSKTIAGGLQVFVEGPTTFFNVGDVVVMNLFLNGRFPGTENPRSVTLSSPEFTIPQEQLWSGFSFVFSECNLAGFAGPDATLVAQYEVTRDNVVLYSETLSVGLSTAATS